MPAAVPANKAEPAESKAAKPARVKLVRDGFTMPESDFALIATLKSRAIETGREVKKSELLRAGLQALAALKPAALRKALDGLAPVPQGRPKKGR